MPASSFDLDLPIGLTSPIENGIAFYQNGKHFDVNYNEVDFPGGNIIARYVKPTSPAAKAKAKSTRPRASDLPQPAPVEETESTEDAVDLEAWAEGTAKYPFFSIRAAVLRQYDKQPENAQEAREIILGNAEEA